MSRYHRVRVYPGYSIGYAYYDDHSNMEDVVKGSLTLNDNRPLHVA